MHRHTEILADALHWEKNQRATQHLLVGKERTAAEDWLLTEFLSPKQPPCKPSTLVCDFICEARKNAFNRMTDIFICYDAEHDKPIRDSVVQSLSHYAKTTWIHDRDIQKGADYARAIELGIEQADNFFYFISPHSVISDYCQKELVHALKYNKCIVPLLIAPTPEPDIPEVLRDLQYVDFTDNTCQADYDSDSDFARHLNTTLQESGKTTWFDQESISTGVDLLLTAISVKRNGVNIWENNVLLKKPVPIFLKIRWVHCNISNKEQSLPKREKWRQR